MPGGLASRLSAACLHAPRRSDTVTQGRTQSLAHMGGGRPRKPGPGTGFPAAANPACPRRSRRSYFQDHARWQGRDLSHCAGPSARWSFHYRHPHWSYLRLCTRRNRSVAWRGAILTNGRPGRPHAISTDASLSSGTGALALIGSPTSSTVHGVPPRRLGRGHPWSVRAPGGRHPDRPADPVTGRHPAPVGWAHQSVGRPAAPLMASSNTVSTARSS